jgi:hypothetical protein
MQSDAPVIGNNGAQGMSTAGRYGRIAIESALAGFAFALLVITVLDPEWIEHVFGIEPDAGSGTAEWLIVVALAGVALIFGGVAALDVRRGLARTD